VGNFGPISDDDEDELEGVHIMIAWSSATEGVSQRVLGKRRNSIVSEVEDGGSESMQSSAEVDLSVPDTQQRSSGRIRKRSRLLDGCEVNVYYFYKSVFVLFFIFFFYFFTR
jgi:hypothetical protein